MKELGGKTIMHEPNIVILAGGISSRMKRSVGKATGIDPSLADDAAHKSKSMIGVGTGGRPFFDYVLYTIAQAGYANVVLLIGERDASVQKYYEEEKHRKAFDKLNISFAVQPIPQGRSKPLGTADALQRALEFRRDWKGQQLTVCNSDNLYSKETLGLLLSSSERNALISYDFDALRFPRERIFQFAILRADSEGYLQNILEKPSEEQLKAAGDKPGVSMNIFRFTYDDIFPYLARAPLHPVRNEKELPEAVRLMVSDHPRSTKIYSRSEYVPDLTTAGDIPDIQKYLHTHFSRIRF